MMRNQLFFGMLLTIIISACSSGSNTSTTTPNLLQVRTFNYDPGNKTAVLINIGGGESIIAEIDTGSEITVVNESVVGANITKTSESLEIIYGAGTNIVSGYLAYGSVQFTTTNGLTLSTSPDTPLLVVTSGSVNQGGGNNAVLGMRMNNQLSARLFLPYPYNQMMILNRSESLITFGNLTPTQLQQFALISQIMTVCDNLGVSINATNTCWDTSESSVTYSYSEDGSIGSTNYTTIFDSGEAIGNFYLESQPTWMVLNNSNDIMNTLSAVVNTNLGALELPLTTLTRYTQPISNSNTVNPGNALFNTYQVLFDQKDGYIGFLNYNESI